MTLTRAPPKPSSRSRGSLVSTDGVASEQARPSGASSASTARQTSSLVGARCSRWAKAIALLRRAHTAPSALTSTSVYSVQWGGNRASRKPSPPTRATTRLIMAWIWLWSGCGPPKRAQAVAHRAVGPSAHLGPVAQHGQRQARQLLGCALDDRRDLLRRQTRSVPLPSSSSPPQESGDQESGISLTPVPCLLTPVLTSCHTRIRIGPRWITRPGRAASGRTGGGPAKSRSPSVRAARRTSSERK